jgi:hypothetical protein
MTALGAAIVFAACATAPPSRYVAEHFRTTRTNFVFVRDTVTGNWVNRRCELRVAVARVIPDTLRTEESGDLMSVQYYQPGSVGTAGLRSIAFETREGYRVWSLEDVLNEDDVAARTSYSVQIAWPQRGEATRHDPMELFHLPGPGAMPPNTWGPWVTASATREGAFAWWDEARGKPPEPPEPIAHPFALRCQIVFTDTPGVVR